VCPATGARISGGSITRFRMLTWGPHYKVIEAPVPRSRLQASWGRGKVLEPVSDHRIRVWRIISNSAQIMKAM
jgi:hypothetical protein